MTDIIDRIAALHKAGTPGHWMDDPECAPCRVFSDYIPPGKTCAIAPVVCETLPLCGDRRAQGPGNAALIVALHEAWPKIERVMRAAKAFRDHVDHGEWEDLTEALEDLET